MKKYFLIVLSIHFVNSFNYLKDACVNNSFVYAKFEINPYKRLLDAIEQKNQFDKDFNSREFENYNCSKYAFLEYEYRNEKICHVKDIIDSNINIDKFYALKRNVSDYIVKIYTTLATEKKYETPKQVTASAKILKTSKKKQETPKEKSKVLKKSSFKPTTKNYFKNEYKFNTTTTTVSVDQPIIKKVCDGCIYNCSHPVTYHSTSQTYRYVGKKNHEILNKTYDQTKQTILIGCVRGVDQWFMKSTPLTLGSLSRYYSGIETNY